jgi:RNA polymerase sigma-70 factor (ECF subfamily)
MYTTSETLLQRLGCGPGGDDWERFVRLYAPLLHQWAVHLGLQDHDAADLVQEVLLLLMRKLPEFRYDPGRSFRSWMHTILKNKWRDRCRADKNVPLPDAVEPEAPPDADALEEREYRDYIIDRALRLMKSNFSPTTWQACWETVVNERPALEVAAELGITANAVYLAKVRVLSCLRQELHGLLDIP